MANLKEVRARIKSVSSTQQITKAMKLVSATKLRKAQNAIVQMRPYALKLQGILANVGGQVDSMTLKPLFDQRPVKNVLLVVITSDRGLCGGFNANVSKLARKIAFEKYAEAYEVGNVTVLALGKKGYEFLSKLKVKTDTSHMTIFQGLNAENAFGVAESILTRFSKKEFDVVELIYNQFKNAATQILTGEVILPVSTQSSGEKVKGDYIFEPGKAEILEDLVPRTIKTHIYRALLDSFASEHGARMIAMDKATDNAGEMLNSLKLAYNQARQAAITNEISEIVGGAAALNG
jgi:F-type H+-transporting ATPase subunit gamma